MIFELCDKGGIMPEINQRCGVTPLSMEDCRNYFTQLIYGIEYLHTNDIAHRDIKPDNLMLSFENVLKIVDFGVSEIFTKDNQKFGKIAGYSFVI